MYKSEQLKNLLNGATILDEVLNQAEQDREEKKPIHKLWNGLKSVRLADIQETQDQKALLFIFVDSNGELMPSQFGDKVGNIYVSIANFNNFILTAKNALNLNYGLSAREVLDELSNKEHEIYFSVKSSVKAWGTSFFNMIDWAQTKKA